MRREYKGAAQAAVLTVALGGSTADLTIICDDLSNWPTGVAYPFYIVIDRGTASEEKILCSSRSGNIILCITWVARLVVALMGHLLLRIMLTLWWSMCLRRRMLMRLTRM